MNHTGMEEDILILDSWLSQKGDLISLDPRVDKQSQTMLYDMKAIGNDRKKQKSLLREARRYSKALTKTTNT